MTQEIPVLLDSDRNSLRQRNYALSTEEPYVDRECCLTGNGLFRDVIKTSPLICQAYCSII